MALKKEAIRIRAFNLQFFSSEKTEPATPRKREQSREEGQSAKSQDLTAALIMITGLVCFLWFGATMWGAMVGLFDDSIRHLSSDVFQGDRWLDGLIQKAGVVFFIGWLPMGALCALVAGGVMVYQVGFMITSKPLIPKPDRMNPISGLKKIISMRTIVEMIKGILKALLLLLILYHGMNKSKDMVMILMRVPLNLGTKMIMDNIWNLAMRMALMLLVLGLFDYLYQKWEFEKSIRMSKQDIKDEYKQMEGDPLIKRRIRQRQRELAKGRMMADVPNADVIITNPTHIAVALQYDQEKMSAPTVTAKGEGHLANKIKELAKEHKIPVMENKPLARALFAQVEVGESVPEDLYRAVAEVLAFVYRLRGDKKTTKTTKK